MGNPSDRVPFDHAKMLMAVTIVVLAVLVYLALNAVLLLGAVVGVAAYVIILYKAGLWRTMVGTSLLVSVLRSGPTSALLGDTTWYLLQFSPIVLAGVALLAAKPYRIRGSDQAVILFMSLFALAALATSLITLAPAATLPQSLLLAVMTAFLLLTYVRRWSSPDVVRGDVMMLFAVTTLVQLVGVGAAVAGQAWPFDPDYGRFSGMYSNANYAGMMSAIGIAAGLYLLRVSKHRIRVLAPLAVLTAALLMSGSRGALTALGIAGLVLMASRSERKIAVPLAAVGSMFLLFVMLVDPQFLDPLDKFFFRDEASPDFTSGRLEIYQNLLNVFQQSPWTGTGYRSVEELTPGISGLTAHNIYLSVLTETGLFGAFFFLALALSVVVASRRGKEGRPLLAAVVTIAAIELTESSIHGWGGPTALIAWVLILAFAASGRFGPDDAAAQDSTVVDRKVESPHPISP